MTLKKLQGRAGIILVSVTVVIATWVTFFRLTKGGLEIEGVGRSDGGSASEIPIPDEMKALTDLYRVINLVQRRYIDASRINPREMFVGAMRAVQLSIARAMVSEDGDELTLKMGMAAKRFSLKEIETPWTLLQRTKDAFVFIDKEATDELDMRKIEYDAINGMLRTLDPHSIFLSPDQYREMQDKTHGNFAGLGIVISIRDGVLTIVSPMDGTPADAAGLTSGDQIVKIDEQSTVNMPLNDAVDLLRGEPGTPVTVHILRKGWAEPRAFTVVRAVVKVESLETHLLAGRIGYVRIKDFQGNTGQDLAQKLEEWRKKDIKGLVLDLRGCPGGLLEAAVEVSDLFLKSGVIVTTAGQDPNEREVRRAADSGNEPDYPIVVAVDQGSASASEILAGALKNHGRALVIGETTFGKGSVQVLFEFSEDNAPNSVTALKLTTAQYLTPGDVSIQSVGVVPNVEVLPVRADAEMIDLHVDGGYRESDLSHHFETSKSGSKKDQPTVSLSYLWTPPKDALRAEGDDAEMQEEPPLPDKNKPFEPDYVAQLAADFVAASAPIHGKSVEDTLAALSPFIADREAKESKHLSQSLKKLGIDWQTAPDAAAPDAASAAVTISIKDGTTLKAGDEAILSLAVHNTGPFAMYQLLAESHSDFRPVDDRELVFGKVAPGETVTRELKFKIPKDALAEVNDVRWSFSGGNTNSPSPSALRFQVIPMPRPHFGYRWRIDDSETGNNDGKVQVGESVKLAAEIHNLGKGSSLNTYATLKSLSDKNVFLSKGRESLDAIAPRAQKTAMFSFEVKPGFSDKEARFEMAFADVDLRQYLVEKISIPVYPAQTDPPLQPALSVKTPSDTVINSAPILEIDPIQPVTKTNTVHVRGLARDESKVRDVYIFVDNDKRFFIANTDPKNPGMLTFEADLPIRNGINYITVVAEEDADLETREMIAIRRDRTDDMPYILTRTLNANDESEVLGVLPVNIHQFFATEGEVVRNLSLNQSPTR